jgi:membrane associated rhomboid family serine protease
MVVYQIYPRKKGANVILNFWEKISLTKKIIFVNILVFILAYFFMGIGILSIDYIAIMPGNILSGKYLWTFVTSMFMHGGFFHLFVNMFSLYFVGTLIERILGRKRYFWFYIIAGILSGVIFVLSAFVFPQDMLAYAVGASGALFGLIGILIFLTPNLPVYVMFIPIPIKMKYAAPGMLVLLWVISIGANVPIGNVAHFGGLLVGLVYGLVLKYRFPRKVSMIQNHFK